MVFKEGVWYLNTTGSVVLKRVCGPKRVCGI